MLGVNLSLFMPPWLPCWLLCSMVVTGKGIYPKPNTNTPPSRGHGILPDQHTPDPDHRRWIIFSNSLDTVSVPLFCSGKIMCASESDFVEKKGVRDKGQKDLGNAKAVTLF